MTDIQIAIFVFGFVLIVLLATILILFLIFTHQKKRYKKLTQTEFDEQLSQNKNMIKAQKILDKDSHGNK